MTIKDILAKKFPFVWDDYSKMHDQLNAAASGFANLGYEDLAADFARARAALGQA